MSGNLEREGARQEELLALDERQERERQQAERFIKLHHMNRQEAAEHRESVSQAQKAERERVEQEHEAQRRQEGSTGG